MPRPHTQTPSDGGTHDTKELPPGGFYFAPGSIDNGKPRRSLGRRVINALTETLILLAIAAAVGFASGWIQTRGLL